VFSVRTSLTQRGPGGGILSGFTHYPHHLILNSAEIDLSKGVEGEVFFLAIAFWNFLDSHTIPTT
jgi:hypothetical protein